MRLSRFAARAAVLGGLMLMPVSAFAQKQTENVDKTMSFPENGVLKLNNFSGDVRITAASGRDIVIKAVRRAEREQLNHIKLDISASGSTVTIDANRRDPGYDTRNHDNNVVETTFEIQLPASAELDVDVFSSALDIRGVTGLQRLKSFSGNITVTGAKRVRAETFNGDLEIDATAAGVSPEVTAETFSGRIRARLADNAKGHVRFDTFSGLFDSDFTLATRSSRGRTVDADLPGGSGPTLSFHTFSGSVKVLK